MSAKVTIVTTATLSFIVTVDSLPTKVTNIPMENMNNFYFSQWLRWSLILTLLIVWFGYVKEPEIFRAGDILCHVQRYAR